MINNVTSEDTAAVIALAEASGLFNSDNIDQIKQSLADYVSGNNDLWLIAIDEKPVGVLYCTPEPMAEGTWNILMLLVSPNVQRQGHGQSLISHVEETLASRGAHLVIVETSSIDEFEKARSFYVKCGYSEEARIRNFYAAGDDKVVFSKDLTAFTKGS
ncbi:MAG: GNAT family N-acetyltransferase [Microcoleaceae cyanobacterium]